MFITVVISSYNLENHILQTVNRLLESDTTGFQRIEVLIIDDGSPVPVAPLLQHIDYPAPFQTKIITQKNSGIGATRNRGFREANTDIILFLDDDILVKKSTLQEIIQAHQDCKSGIIFGSYPFISHESESLQIFAKRLYGYDEITDEKKYEKVHAITSGLLSVNKSLLPNKDYLYRDDLTIPAAEEHEIIFRCFTQNIPIIFAKNISATHNHHLQLDWLAKQQYKYGLAAAEVFEKYPDIIEMPKFAALKNSLDSISQNNDFKSRFKSSLTLDLNRKMIFNLSKIIQKILPNSDHNYLYGLVATVNLWSGYLEGQKRFSNHHG